MSDVFLIVPPTVRAEGKDVPPENIQAGFNSICQQATVALNSVAADPTGPASGDLSGFYPGPTVVAVHATGGTMSGVAVTGGTINNTPIGATTPSTGAFTTVTATTPVAATSGGTGRNALNANAVIIGEGSSPVNFAAPGVAGTILASNGAAADPSFQSKAALTIASSGANSDITSLSGLTTALSVGQGGTGRQTLTNHGVLVGAAAAAISQTAAGTTGQMLLGVTGADPAFGNNPTITAGTINGAVIGGTTPAAGSFTTVAATGTITPSSTNGIVGTTTNDNANAGSVGEFISSTVLTGSAVSLTNNIAANVTSISLTAGDWDVWGNVAFNSSANNLSSVRAWTSATSATAPTQPNNGGDTLISLTSGIIGAGTEISAGMQRFSLATTTTVFLSALSAFASGTASAFGFIGARRRR